MKKIVFGFLFSIISVSYASAYTCVDLKSPVIRRQENANVLTLQKYLVEKGYLTATPNGYFGPGTFAAVQAYQRSLGYEAVGTVGPMTRAALKRDSCGVSSATTVPQLGTVVTTPVVTTIIPPTTTSQPVLIASSIPTVNTPSGLRNAQRRVDLEKLLRALSSRYVETRGVHPVKVTAIPIELCVRPPVVASTGTSTEVAVYSIVESPCKEYVDVTNLDPIYLKPIPRDPSLTTSSMLLGYEMTRNEYNDITLSAKAPEDSAIVKVTCNFNGQCKNIRHITAISYDAPTVASSSRYVIIRDATPKDPLTVYGTSFSSSTNTVIMTSNYSGKQYNVGTFASTNSTTLSIPASSTNQIIPCGAGCYEKIPNGTYGVTITNEWGKSNIFYLNIKGFSTSSFTARSNTSAPPDTKNVKLGSVTVSTGIPVAIKSITLNATSTSSVLPTKLSNFVVKETMSGQTAGTGAGTITISNQSLYENQSLIFDIYADIGEVQPHEAGFITYGGYMTVTDTFSKADMDLPLKEFSFTVSR